MASVYSPESGQQSYTGTYSGPPAPYPPTLFSFQQAVVHSAINTWPAHPLKFLYVVLECLGPRAAFYALDIYNGQLWTGDIDPAYVKLNDCRSYRSHHTAWAPDTVNDDTQDGNFYPSETQSGPWYYSGWYWKDPRSFQVSPSTPYVQYTTVIDGEVSASSDPAYEAQFGIYESRGAEWDMSGQWSQMVTYLSSIDMAPPWVYSDPSRPNSKRFYLVNRYGGAATSLSSVPPGLGPGGSYDGSIYLTSSSGLVTGTADSVGAAYDPAYNGSIYNNTGLHMPWSPTIGGNPGNLYTERVQVKFNLPITYAFVEVMVGVGTVTTYYYSVRQIGLLEPETVIEVPAPVMFAGAPVLFGGPGGPLCATQSTVYMIVNESPINWINHQPGPRVILNGGFSVGVSPPPVPPLVPPTADSTLVTADTLAYTADAS